MNAYELADKWEEQSVIVRNGLCLPTANMLRQQADRIAELEKLVHERFDDGKRLGVIETEDRFRLATPQTKPLSDEEIMNLYQESMKSLYTHKQSYFGFARAIEERHGIK